MALIAVYAVALGNGPWWSALSAGRAVAAPATWLFLGCTFVALAALHFVLFALVSNRWTARPLLTVLVIATAFASYYMRTYAVILDPSMLRNVVKTDVHETRELLSLAMLGWVLAWSLLPVAFVWWVDLERSPPWRAAAFRAAALIGGLAIAAAALLPVSRDLTSVMRNQRELRYLVTPGNFIYSLARNAARDARGAALPRVAVGTDARSQLGAVARSPPAGVRAGARRDRARGELLAVRLCPRDQSAAGRARHRRLQRRHRLRHLDRDLGALHVLAPGARRLRRAADQALRRRAGRAGARRLRRALVRQPVGLQGSLRRPGHRRPASSMPTTRPTCAAARTASTRSWSARCARASRA